MWSDSLCSRDPCHSWWKLSLTLLHLFILPQILGCWQCGGWAGWRSLLLQLLQIQVSPCTRIWIFSKLHFLFRFLSSANRPLGAGKTTTILAGKGDADQCPRCLGRVFQAEQVLSANAVYHKACFRCAEVECGRALDSTSYCDSPQGIL